MLVESLISEYGGLFNIAGQTSQVDSMTDPYADLEINCRAQLFILGVETMIHYPVPTPAR